MLLHEINIKKASAGLVKLQIHAATIHIEYRLIC